MGYASRNNKKELHLMTLDKASETVKKASPMIQYILKEMPCTPIKRVALYNATLQTIQQHPDVDIMTGMMLAKDLFKGQLSICEQLLPAIEKKDPTLYNELYGWAL